MDGSTVHLSESVLPEKLDSSPGIHVCVIKPRRRASFKSLYSWYWPTSVSLSHDSENRLLSFGKIGLIYSQADIEPLKKSSHPLDCYGYFRDIEVGTSKFIHTLHIKKSLDDLLSHMSIPTNRTLELLEETSVVVCHGFGAGLGFFYKNYAALSTLPNSTIYGIDWLGMGRSSRPKFPKSTIESNFDDLNSTDSLDFFVSSLEDWRKAQRLKTMVLVGHSLGGYIATFYALKYPENVSHLLLLSPVGVPAIPESVRLKMQSNNHVTVVGSTMPSWLVSMWNNHMTPQSIIRAVGPAGPSFTNRYVDARFSYLSNDEKFALKDYLYHISADSGSGEFALTSLLTPGAWAKDPLEHHLKDLKVPIWFYYGAIDWMDPKSAQTLLPSLTVPSGVSIVPDAGHHLYLDNPEIFNSILLDHLRKWLF